MSVSIIVPNYNHREFLPQRLETIFNQTFQDFEVILLDDCSTDESWDYLKGFAEHPKVSYCIRNEINSGSPFSQWSKGIELSKFSLIWIAESDDFCENSFLEIMVSNLRPESVLIYCASIFVNAEGIIQEGRFPNWFRKDQDNFSRWQNNYSNIGISEISDFLAYKNTIVNASSVVFRKSISFPKDIKSMRFCGDWYFWIFLLKDGELDFCAKGLNYFRTRDLVSSVTLKDKEHARLLEILKCIKFSRNVLNIHYPRYIDFVRYSDLVKYYAWNFTKLKLSFSSIMEFPYYLLPVFMYQYLKHILHSIFKGSIE